MYAASYDCPLPFPQPDSYKLKKNYTFEKTLGVGSFGEVKQAIWNTHDPPLPVAVKIIKKKPLKGQFSIVYDEMDVLKGLDCPNVGELSSCLLSPRCDSQPRQERRLR